jgi:hypothetical protein
MTTHGHTHAGGCQCGAIRYQAEGPLDSPEICHCRMCQKAHGAPAVTWASVPEAALHWTRGQPASFESSANAIRGFCADCGTPLTFKRRHANTIDIALATLDHPDLIAPEYQSGVESRMPWFGTVHLLREERMEECDHSRQHPDHETDHWP